VVEGVLADVTSSDGFVYVEAVLLSLGLRGVWGRLLCEDAPVDGVGGMGEVGVVVGGGGGSGIHHWRWLNRHSGEASARLKMKETDETRIEAKTTQTSRIYGIGYIVVHIEMKAIPISILYIWGGLNSATYRKDTWRTKTGDHPPFCALG